MNGMKKSANIAMAADTLLQGLVPADGASGAS